MSRAPRGVHREVDPLEDLLAVDGRVKVLDLQHRLAHAPFEAHAEEFLRFDANSIGSSRKTSLQKPLRSC